MLAACAGQGADQLIELVLPSDQRPVRRHRLRLDAGPGLERLPDLKWLCLALRLHCVDVPIVDYRLRRSIRRLADDHAVDGRGRLKPGGRVDDVTRSHSLAGFGTRPEVDQGLTGVHGDPNLHRIVLAGPVPDRERCSHRTFRIVLVCNGRAEESHHRIADELLHRAAEPLELATQALVVGTENRLDVFGIELLCTRCEADEVGEQHRHHFALTPTLHGQPRRSTLYPRSFTAARICWQCASSRVTSVTPISVSLTEMSTPSR